MSRNARSRRSLRALSKFCMSEYSCTLNVHRKCIWLRFIPSARTRAPSVATSVEPVTPTCIFRCPVNFSNSPPLALVNVMFSLHLVQRFFFLREMDRTGLDPTWGRERERERETQLFNSRGKPSICTQGHPFTELEVFMTKRCNFLCLYLYPRLLSGECTWHARTGFRLHTSENKMTQPHRGTSTKTYHPAPRFQCLFES